MEPLQYEVRGYLREPFRLFHLADGRRERIEYHYHTFHKIIILLAGKAGYAIEGERYDLSPGDFVLVGRGSIHRPEVAEDAFYERMILYIAPQYLASLGTEDCDLEECFRQAQDSFRYVYRDEGGSRVRQLFETLARTVRQGGYGAALLERAQFLELMVEVNRVCRGGHQVQAASGRQQGGGAAAIPEPAPDGGADHRPAVGAVLRQQVPHDAAVSAGDGLFHPRLCDGEAAAAGPAAAGPGGLAIGGGGTGRVSGLLHILPRLQEAVRPRPIGGCGSREHDLHGTGQELRFTMRKMPV